MLCNFPWNVHVPFCYLHLQPTVLTVELRNLAKFLPDTDQLKSTKWVLSLVLKRFSKFCSVVSVKSKRLSSLWPRKIQMFPSNVHINILRGLPCRLESLCLKFTNEPSIFVDGDLDESIKRSASDRLGDLVPQVWARTSPGVFRDMALLGLCLELSFKNPKPGSQKEKILYLAKTSLSYSTGCHEVKSRLLL